MSMVDVQDLAVEVDTRLHNQFEHLTFGYNSPESKKKNLFIVS